MIPANMHVDSDKNPPVLQQCKKLDLIHKLILANLQNFFRNLWQKFLKLIKACKKQSVQ